MDHAQSTDGPPTIGVLTGRSHEGLAIFASAAAYSLETAEGGAALLAQAISFAACMGFDHHSRHRNSDRLLRRVRPLYAVHDRRVRPGLRRAGRAASGRASA